MIDITPTFPIVSSAEVPGGIVASSNSGEIIPSGTMVQPKKIDTIGGMQAGATSLYQGSGDNLIMISSKGLHLGAANFEDAPFSVNMSGDVIASSIVLSGYTTDSDVTTIIGDTVTTSFVNALSITAGSVNAEDINAGTITGSTLRTASSGQRVIIDGSNNDIRFYDSSGTYEGRIVGSSTGGVFISGVNYVSMAIGSTNYFTSGIDGVNIAWKDILPSSSSITLGDDSNPFGYLYTNAIKLDGLFISSWSDIDDYLPSYALLSGATFTGDVSLGSNDFRAGGYHYFNSGNNNVYIYSTGSNLSFKDGSGTYASLSALKTAIVPTSKGFNALYCMESPSVWFMDFCEEKGILDPMFIEVTTGPYKYIKCEDGGYQVWGKRKGYESIRFESKTQEEFIANEKFLNMNKPVNNINN